MMWVRRCSNHTHEEPTSELPHAPPKPDTARRGCSAQIRLMISGTIVLCALCVLCSLSSITAGLWAWKYEVAGQDALEGKLLSFQEDNKRMAIVLCALGALCVLWSITACLWVWKYKVGKDVLPLLSSQEDNKRIGATDMGMSSEKAK
jgi:hypothetical protein